MIKWAKKDVIKAFEEAMNPQQAKVQPGQAILDKMLQARKGQQVPQVPRV